ncbi:N-acetyltransferase [Erythrobacter sp.]|uniref:N-acetyltransferase n=1 Tax=Erythrobacter sp. TaxID=1042 RepID=UPI00311E1E3E
MTEIAIHREEGVRHGRYVARDEGFRIIPLCPYVRARCEKHPDWRDVMTVEPGVKPKITGGLEQ